VHVDKAWLGRNAPTLLSEATGCPVTVLNDADAAGYAEMRFGAGQSQHGVVLLVTLGTGIGSALFVDGHLVPNTELGHIEVRGQDAEWFCQVVEAETLIRRVSAPRLSSQPFRRPAPCS
jgi:polyphosphate glucokinase